MASSIFITFFIGFYSLSALMVNSQTTESCSSNLNLSTQVPFDTKSLKCQSVWASQNFILRYVQTSSNLWSFVLSTPDTNSYVAIGFSSDGQMVRSSAIVGWISTTDGTGTIKQYYLGGQSPSLVEPDQGNLKVPGNSSAILSENGRIYLAFQLNTSQPSSRVLYSVGPAATLPSAPSYTLTEHRDKVSTTFNYVTGQTSSDTPYSTLTRTHGFLATIGWGVLMIIGAIVARYFKEYDPTWFYAHIGIQSLGFVLGVAGSICGFVLTNKLTKKTDTHNGIGIFILVLGCFQMTALLVRPLKTSKLRIYWNWYHYIGGWLVFIFSISNVFYGAHLSGQGNSWNPGYGAILAILFITIVVLEFRMRFRK